MKPYKLVAKRSESHKTVITVGTATFGGPEVVVIAGPCAVEGEEAITKLAKKMKESGAKVLRGGAFKPRTSPYAFQGLAEEGLYYLSQAREVTGLPIVTEVMDTRDMPIVYEHADIIQIGSRNMQNFALLKEAGSVDKPILLKRGLSATIDEWLMAAEYIMAEGNEKVILCERGIRTFETQTRNTLDLSAVPLLKSITHLPVIVDPSHATGRADLVSPLAKGSVAVGADGLMIEVHQNPCEALCDGPQSLTPEEFRTLMREVRQIEQSLKSLINV